MSYGSTLTIPLVLLLIGVIPAWPHSTGWGYGPSVGPVGWFLSPQSANRSRFAEQMFQSTVKEAKGLQKQAEGKLQKGVGDLKEAVKKG
jgi:hypothetical protein